MPETAGKVGPENPGHVQEILNGLCQKVAMRDEVGRIEENLRDTLQPDAHLRPAKRETVFAHLSEERVSLLDLAVPSETEIKCLGGPV